MPDQPIGETPIQLRSEGSSKATERSIHLVTMSKGGCGKSTVAWNLLQYLQDRGSGAVTGIDLDTVSHTLSEYPGLGVRTVDLLGGPEMTLDVVAADQLAEDLLLGDGSFVLDNGASGFVALTRYLVDSEFPGMLGGASYNGRLVVHAVLGGGTMSAQCLVGLDTLLKEFPAEVRFVAWLNEFQDPFSVTDIAFENMAVYERNKARFLGVVRLRALPKFYAEDFKRLHRDRLTFSEALDGPKFMLMNKQRLTVLRRDLWSQLDEVKLT